MTLAPFQCACLPGIVIMRSGRVLDPEGRDGDRGHGLDFLMARGELAGIPGIDGSVLGHADGDTAADAYADPPP